MNIPSAVGIDMSKRTFHAAFDAATIRAFKNDEEGFSLFLQVLGHHGLSQTETVIGVEATGAYHLAFAVAMTKQGWRTVVINPLESHRFAVSQSIRTVKNDRKDASLVRQMVLLGRGYPFRDTNHTIALKALITEREGLVLMGATLKHRAEAHTAKQRAATVTLHDSGTALAKVVRREIHGIDQRLGRYAPETQALLRTIPGIGIFTFAALVAFIGDIRYFPSPEKLTAFLGLDCRVFESGTSIHGKGFISKRGNGL